MLRYVAVLDGEWVALVGFGSAALSCAARDRRHRVEGLAPDRTTSNKHQRHNDTEPTAETAHLTAPCPWGQLREYRAA